MLNEEMSRKLRVKGKQREKKGKKNAGEKKQSAKGTQKTLINLAQGEICFCSKKKKDVASKFLFFISFSRIRI